MTTSPNPRRARWIAARAAAIAVEDGTPLDEATRQAETDWIEEMDEGEIEGAWNRLLKGRG